MTAYPPIGQPRLLDRTREIGGVVFWVLCLFWLVAASIGLAVHVTDQRRLVYDFSQEWTSARDFWAGRPVYGSFPDSLEFHLGRRVETPIRFNAHPPASVLLALPLAPLEQFQAYLAWTAISIGCLATSLWLMLRAPGIQLSATETLGFATLAVAGNAVSHHLIQGQVNLLLLLLVTGAWSADRRGFSAAGGVLVGIAAALKLFPAFLVLYYLTFGKWRGLGGVLLGFAAFNLLALAVLGLEPFVDYTRTVLPATQEFRDWWGNASLWGFWSKLLDGSSGQVVPIAYHPRLAWCLGLLSCLLAVVCTIRRTFPLRNSPLADLPWAAFLVTMLLVSPITWEHYFVLLFLPGLIVWKASRHRPARACFVLAVLGLLVTVNGSWIVVAVLPDDVRPAQTPAGPVWVLTVLSYQFYALLGLAVATFRQLADPVANSPGEVPKGSSAA
jgi:hypothetical protein